MKEKLMNNFILKILSVFLAILCWIVVININDPIKTRTVTGIKVHMFNDTVITDHEQVYSISEGQIISVKVTGPRTIVDSLRAGDFTATADFMDISQANSVPIQVELNKYEYQPKVTINEQSHKTLRLEIEKVTEKDYDIGIKYTGTVASGYIVADTALSQNKVTIKAAESIHESIQKVYALVNVEGVTEDSKIEAPLKIMSTSGVELVQANLNPNTSIQMQMDVTYVWAENSVYYLNTISLDYDLPDIDSDIEIVNESLNVENISIMGKKEAVTEISSIQLPVNEIVIDEESNTYTQEFNMEQLLPQGIYLAPDSKKTVVLTVNFESIITKTKVIEKNEIAIKNIPNGYDASIVGNEITKIVIEGKESVLETFNMDELIAFVSVGEFLEGVSLAKVEVQLPEGLSMAEDVYVNVSLTKTQMQTTEQRESTESTEPPETQSTQQVTETTTINQQTEESTDSSETESETSENVTGQEETTTLPLQE